MVTFSCPGEEELRLLALDGLPGPGSDWLAEHFIRCGQCQEAVRILEESDTLMRALRSPGGTPDDFEQKQVEGLIAHIKAAVRAGGTGPAVAVPPPDATDPMPVAEILTLLEPPQQPDEIGRLACYRILRALGSGGMGVVFQAEDVRLLRQVALKVLRPEITSKPEARERFLREARAAASIEHDHVISIHEVGEDRGVMFLAMPW